MSDNPKDVVLDRTVDAPAERVWHMWTDPDHFAQWYGPQGASIPIAEFDLRVGGRRFVAMEMETPDGAMRMYFTGEHRVIEPVTRLSYTEAMATETGDRLTNCRQVTRKSPRSESRWNHRVTRQS